MADTNTASCGRWAGAAVALAVVAVWLLLLYQLSPPTSGHHGTHTQLGLPSCGFLMRTGWPCIGCGVTTSLALAARGRFLAAADAQAFGVVVMASLWLLGAAGAVQAVTGRRTLRWIAVRWRYWVLLLAVALVGGWMAKVLIGKATGIYPIK